jgi:hypothetical protein
MYVYRFLSSLHRDTITRLSKYFLTTLPLTAGNLQTYICMAATN